MRRCVELSCNYRDVYRDNETRLQTALRDWTHYVAVNNSQLAMRRRLIQFNFLLFHFYFSLSLLDISFHTASFASVVFYLSFIDTIVAVKIIFSA